MSEGGGTGRNPRSQRGGKSGVTNKKGGVKPSVGADSSKTPSGKRTKSPRSTGTPTGNHMGASAASKRPADDGKLPSVIGEIRDCQTPTKEQSGRMDNLLEEQQSLLREIEVLNAQRLRIKDDLGNISTLTEKPTASNEENDKDDDPVANVTSIKQEDDEPSNGEPSTDVVTPPAAGHDAEIVNDTIEKLLSSIAKESKPAEGEENEDDKDIPTDPKIQADIIRDLRKHQRNLQLKLKKVGNDAQKVANLSAQREQQAARETAASRQREQEAVAASNTLEEQVQSAVHLGEELSKVATEKSNVVNAKLSKELAKATEIVEKQRRALEAAQAKLKQSEDTRFKVTKSTQRKYNWDESTSDEEDEDDSKGGSRNRGDDDGNDEDDEDDGDGDDGDDPSESEADDDQPSRSDNGVDRIRLAFQIYMRHYRILGFYPYTVHFNDDGQIEDVLESYTPNDKISKRKNIKRVNKLKQVNRDNGVFPAHILVMMMSQDNEVEDEFGDQLREIFKGGRGFEKLGKYYYISGKECTLLTCGSLNNPAHQQFKACEASDAAASPGQMITLQIQGNSFHKVMEQLLQHASRNRDEPQKVSERIDELKKEYAKNQAKMAELRTKVVTAIKRFDFNEILSKVGDRVTMKSLEPVCDLIDGQVAGFLPGKLTSRVALFQTPSAVLAQKASTPQNSIYHSASIPVGKDNGEMEHETNLSPQQLRKTNIMSGPSMNKDDGINDADQAFSNEFGNNMYVCPYGTPNHASPSGDRESMINSSYTCGLSAASLMSAYQIFPYIEVANKNFPTTPPTELDTLVVLDIIEEAFVFALAKIFEKIYSNVRNEGNLRSDMKSLRQGFTRRKAHKCISQGLWQNGVYNLDPMTLLLVLRYTEDLQSLGTATLMIANMSGLQNLADPARGANERELVMALHELTSIDMRAPDPVAFTEVGGNILTRVLEEAVPFPGIPHPLLANDQVINATMIYLVILLVSRVLTSANQQTDDGESKLKLGSTQERLIRKFRDAAIDKVAAYVKDNPDDATKPELLCLVYSSYAKFRGTVRDHFSTFEVPSGRKGKKKKGNHNLPSGMAASALQMAETLTFAALGASSVPKSKEGGKKSRKQRSKRETKAPETQSGSDSEAETEYSASGDGTAHNANQSGRAHESGDYEYETKEQTKFRMALTQLVQNLGDAGQAQSSLNNDATDPNNFYFNMHLGLAFPKSAGESFNDALDDDDCVRKFIVVPQYNFQKKEFNLISHQDAIKKMVDLGVGTRREHRKIFDNILKTSTGSSHHDKAPNARDVSAAGGAHSQYHVRYPFELTKIFSERAKKNREQWGEWDEEELRKVAGEDRKRFIKRIRKQMLAAVNSTPDQGKANNANAMLDTDDDDDMDENGSEEAPPSVASDRSANTSKKSEEILLKGRQRQGRRRQVPDPGTLSDVDIDDSDSPYAGGKASPLTAKQLRKLAKKREKEEQREIQEQLKKVSTKALRRLAESRETEKRAKRERAAAKQAAKQEAVAKAAMKDSSSSNDSDGDSSSSSSNSSKDSS